MSTAIPSSPAKSKSKRSKERDRDHERKQLPGERLKIVVRRLPPNLPEDIFWHSVSNWVTDDTVAWKSYFPGKPKKRMNGENIPSRAYIAFKSPEHLLIFSREYDGHKFIDKAGNESYAIVEFAPYQKVPGEKKKPDSRNATIEKDEDYISFIESLKVQSNAEPVTLETLVASTRPASPPKTTPLLEALKAERQAQKDKEAIIRNHPHYKDLMNAPNPNALRKEEKRKAARAEVPPPSSVGKKPKKGAPIPAPPKQVQIQAKPSSNGGLADKPASGSSSRPSGRPGRVKHVAKGPTEATPAPPSTSVPPTPLKDAIPTDNSPQQSLPSAPTPTTSARRGRPVLGLGSRHFEAALNGVGVNGERKRKEKGKEIAAVTTSAPDTNVQDKPVSAPVSPRRPRHRKEGPPGAAASPALPDTNGSSTFAMQQGEGTSVQPNFHGRGGRRGGRGGRGRGGPPRVG